MQTIKQDVGIGRNIKRLRKRAGLTQEQVVSQMQLLGVVVSRTGYIKIERERQNIKVSELKALQLILRADYKEFFTEA